LGGLGWKAKKQEARRTVYVYAVRAVQERGRARVKRHIWLGLVMVKPRNG
jgi:hypothetical protein